MATNEPKEEKGNFLSHWKNKVRIVIMNDETFEESGQFLVSRFNVLVFGIFIFLVISVGTYFLIAHTPLKQFIPGYPNISQEKLIRAKDRDNLELLEILEHKAMINERFYNNLATILEDEVPQDSIVYDSVSAKDKYKNISFPKSAEDSILRAQIDQKEKYTLIAEKSKKNQDKMAGVFFFSPVSGTVSNEFNIAAGHFGIDIVAPKDEAIKSTLDGTVIFKEWTHESGHVIHVQHSHNLISIYKHNSFLLKEVGELVKAGDPIAIIGNTGEHSSGPHLHFEIWHKGIPLNPEDYIAFSR